LNYESHKEKKKRKNKKKKKLFSNTCPDSYLLAFSCIIGSIYQSRNPRGYSRLFYNNFLFSSCYNLSASYQHRQGPYHFFGNNLFFDFEILWNRECAKSDIVNLFGCCCQLLLIKELNIDEA